MGGSIGFTIREENGKEHRMCRWTNSMPYFINNIGLVEKDQTHLDNYLKTWVDFIEDYKRLKGERIHNMTDVYAPYPFLAPMDYGLVIVDYKTNNILHLQGYCSFGDFYSSLILKDLSREYKMDRTALEAFTNLFLKDKITDLFLYDINKEDKLYMSDEIKIDSTTELDTLIDAFKKRQKANKDTFFDRFIINMNPWTVQRFPESKAGLADFKAKVIELGFELTAEEEKMWNEFYDYDSE